VFKKTNLGSFNCLSSKNCIDIVDDFNSSTHVSQAAQVPTNHLIQLDHHITKLTTESIPTTSNKISDKVNLSKSDLNDIQKDELRKLIDSYSDVFATSLTELGCTNIVEHTIDIDSNAKPIRSVPYRVNPTDKKIIEQHINELQQAGIIRESKSPWASPIVLVRRPGSDKTRMAIDYRKINSITRIDSQPLPRIDDCLDSLGEGQPQFFTCLDILSGYMQIKMAPDSIEKTAFTSHLGNFEYLRMPFGLVNGTQCFGRLMQNVLRSLLWSICLIYVDDCIIFSKTW
jgi:hypothetical protein